MQNTQNNFYYQANSDGSVATGSQPEGPSKSDIINTLKQALTQNGWKLNQETIQRQPYLFKISAEERIMDIYIYCWRISNGGRTSRPHEQRIQIGNVGDEGFQIDNSSDFKRGLLLGMYQKAGEEPIIVAWETEKNRNHGSSKSCFVDIRSIARAMRDGFVQTKDNDGNLVCVFKKEFLNFYIANMKSLHIKDFSQQSNEIEYSQKSGAQNVEETFQNEYEFVQNGTNKIIYGAPGVGKSYRLGKESIRVTFHPEYSYFDFIGGLKPVKESNGEISYSFVPGPFTRALKVAYDTPREMHTFVIEEINRANTAAVFGDIFQLLDRDDKGWSEYSVENKEILEYLNRDRDKQTPIQEVKIPSNLNLFATMNSADQGVFVMDSAFKRRWEFEYVGISFDGVKHAQNRLKYRGYTITWNHFAHTINEYLSVALGVNEDKLIGPYFMKGNELEDNKKIAYKLLIYLWDDVVRHQRNELFKNDYGTFGAIADAFIKGGQGIFIEELDQRLLEKKDILIGTSGLNE